MLNYQIIKISEAYHSVSHMRVLSGCSPWGNCISSCGHSGTHTSPIFGLFHLKDLIPICIHQQKGQELGEIPVGGYNRQGCNIGFSPTSLAMMRSCGHRRSWEVFQWCASGRAVNFHGKSTLSM